MRLLIAEDDGDLQHQLRRHFEQEGYGVEVAETGAVALYLASEFPFDAFVLDLGLPQLNGLEIIRRLRDRGSALPILALTARGRWQDRVLGLETGADDYLVKPFQVEELTARVRALVRRARGGTGSVTRCGAVAIDLDGQRVTVKETEVELTGFEYRLLEYLARRPGNVVSKAELRDYLYPHDSDPDSNVIEVVVGRLRRKLDPGGALQPIETLRGRGYRLAT
jgi:two-component system response regulator PhoP